MHIHFGQFLKNKKVITDEQLERALSMQTNGRHEFGFIASMDGEMEDSKVELVLNALNEEKNVGKKFSTVLRELAIMPSHHVDKIEKLEEEMNNKIGDTLIKLKYISIEEFNTYFKEFSGLINV
tara:strand:- start:883 stop:1254 length:372 start_codon:yes stop_codon:yes gene_type:complete